VAVQMSVVVVGVAVVIVRGFARVVVHGLIVTVEERLAYR